MTADLDAADYVIDSAQAMKNIDALIMAIYNEPFHDGRDEYASQA